MTFHTRDLQMLDLTEMVHLRQFLQDLGFRDHELIQTVIVDAENQEHTIIRVRYLDPAGIEHGNPARPHRIATMWEVVLDGDYPLPSVVRQQYAGQQAQSERLHP